MVALSSTYALQYSGSGRSTSAKASSLSDGGPLKVSHNHMFINIFPDASFADSAGNYFVDLHLVQYCLVPGLIFTRPLLQAGSHWSVDADRLGIVLKDLDDLGFDNTAIIC